MTAPQATQPLAVVEVANLFFTEGSSDKVYNAELCRDDEGFTVRFSYGRRGKALKSGEKGRGLSEERARMVFGKLVREKMAKGYTEAEHGAAFSSALHAGQDTGFRPQLLNEIALEDALEFGDDWLVQVKHDGERRGLIFEDGTTRFANRRGLEVAVQEPIARDFSRLSEIVGGDLVLDAEDMGEYAVIFDVQKHFMLQAGTFQERAAILAHLEKTIQMNGLGRGLFVDVPSPASRFFPTVEILEGLGGEGFVLRHAESRYSAGRPNSGGDALKVKFWAEATCRVAPGRDDRNSVGLELQDGIDGPWRAVGNVTVPAGAKPEVGALIEVRYLYAREGGALFQPTFRGLRTDLTEDAAQMSQLKFEDTVRAVSRLQGADISDAPGL